MAWFILIIVIFCLLIYDGMCENNFADSRKEKSSVARGYYGGLGIPYLPFSEPIIILAGLAFLAYIIQIFHTLFHHHNHGGLLGGVLPPKGKNIFSKENETEVLKTLN